MNTTNLKDTRGSINESIIISVIQMPGSPLITSISLERGQNSYNHFSIRDELETD